MPPSEAEREASTMDVCCQQIFAMLEAFPRFKDLAMDPLRPASEAPEQQRGGLLFTGPLKMLQTIAMITQAGKASTAADRPPKTWQIRTHHCTIRCLVRRQILHGVRTSTFESTETSTGGSTLSLTSINRTRLRC